MLVDTFANRLQKAMRIRELKQVELVEKTGLDKSLISNYLSGNYKAKQDKLTILAEALDISESWLMGYDVPIQKTAKKKGIKIPVIGRISAGMPIEAVEDIIDYEEIDEELAKKGEFFGLVVKGDSMFPYIIENDILIVRKQEDVESGDIAVVLVNGQEATIKKLIKNEDRSITLKAFNPMYAPATYTKDKIKELPVTIIGRFAELRRKGINC